MATPKSDKNWKAEGDADTLARAAQIRADSARLNRARRAAGKMAKEETVRANSLRRLAKNPPKRRRE